MTVGSRPMILTVRDCCSSAGFGWNSIADVDG